MILFGLFVLVTLAMFDRMDRRALGWRLVATGALGLLVELLEGATRTGNCRLTDLLPDLTGALVAMALTVAFVRARVDHPLSDGVGGDGRSTLLL
jgi:VanZ family protein